MTKVDYLTQLVRFKIHRKMNSLTTKAIALYYILLEYNNELFWIERFTATNLALQDLSGLSRRDLDNARGELIRKGYIEYKKGSGSQCGTYLIVRFDTQPDTQPDTQTDTQTDTQPDTQLDTQPDHINKTKQKQKQNKDISSASHSFTAANGHRARYSESEHVIIDQFFDILKHTRKSAKLADSIIQKCYEDWEKHEVQKVIYALQKYIQSPQLHSKQENYVLGIMRHSDAAEIEKEQNKSNNPAQRPSAFPRNNRFANFTQREMDEEQIRQLEGLYLVKQ